MEERWVVGLLGCLNHMWTMFGRECRSREPYISATLSGTLYLWSMSSKYQNWTPGVKLRRMQCLGVLQPRYVTDNKH